MATRTYRRFRPLHYEIIRRSYSLQSNIEIAAALGCSEQTVSNVINSADGIEILQRMLNRTLDTTIDMHLQIQAALPLIIEKKVETALYGSDAKLRDKAQTDLMTVGGMTAATRLRVPEDEAALMPYKDLTEDELREKLLAESRKASAGPGSATPPTAPPESSSTVH